jgi:hypothetical protein
MSSVTLHEVQVCLSQIRTTASGHDGADLSVCRSRGAESRCGAGARAKESDRGGR